MNFYAIEASLRDRLLSGVRLRQFNRGDVVYTPSDAADVIGVVESGRVKIVRTHASGAETIVGIRARGELFGELDWLVEQPARTSTAAAIEVSSVYLVPVAKFTSVVESDVTLARAFARLLAERLASIERELAGLAGKSVPGRLVDVLGRLARDHGVEEGDGTIRIAVNLTHKDLADLIGTSRETLTKELGVLADVGLLRVAHRTITLLAPRAFPFARRVEEAR